MNIWKGYGAKPKVLSWDQEPALLHCAAELWAQHSLRVEHTSPDAHERVAERGVRTIKEHVYATILGLGHAVDSEMIDGIVRDTVTLLNFFPNAETVDGTPRTYLDGERLNYERWSRVYAGQVAEFEIPYAKQLGRGARKEIGYVIGHQGDNPVVRLLPSGKRLVVRSGHINVLDKSPAILSLIEKGIQGAKRQHFNDLIAEMQEFFSEETENWSRHPEAPARPTSEEGFHDLPEPMETMRLPEAPLSPVREEPAVVQMEQDPISETPLQSPLEIEHHNVLVPNHEDLRPTPSNRVTTKEEFKERCPEAPWILRKTSHRRQRGGLHRLSSQSGRVCKALRRGTDQVGCNHRSTEYDQGQGSGQTSGLSQTKCTHHPGGSIVVHVLQS